MWADPEDELLRMADRIGVARKWVQRPPKASWVHFDESLNMKAKAIVAGAVLTDMFGPLEFLARQDLRSGDVDRIIDGRRQLRKIAVSRSFRTCT